MDKKYTAEEAAKAVLKKAGEMLKSSKLIQHGDLTNKFDQGVPLAQAEVEPSGIEQHASIDKENGNPTWGTEPGCHKLSKFMGRREEKSKAKSSPAPAPAAPEKEIK